MAGQQAQPCRPCQQRRSAAAFAALAIAEKLVPNIGAYSLPEPAGMSLSLSITRCASVTDG